MARKNTPRRIGFYHIPQRNALNITKVCQQHFSCLCQHSFQFQFYFIVTMSNPNEQIPPPLPHEAPPPLCCSTPPAAPGGLMEKPINRSAVAVGPPYLQCYYPDTSFQKFQSHHKFSVAETSQSQSPPPPAVMDPSVLLNSNASNNSSIKQTNLMEQMSPTAQQTKSPSKEGEFCHPFFLLSVQG